MSFSPNKKTNSVKKRLNSIEKIADNAFLKYLEKQDLEKNPKELVKKNVLKTESPFNFENFKFYNPLKLLDHKEYLQEFVKESKLNKDKIDKQMTQLIYIQVIDKLNQEFPNLPKIFFENKLRWCNLMLKNKQLHVIFSEYQNKIYELLEREIINNREQVGRFLIHPRTDEESTTLVKNINHEILRSKSPSKMAHISSNSMDEQTSRKRLGILPGKTAAQLKLEKDLKEVSLLKEEYKKIQMKVSDIENLVENFEMNNDNLGMNIMKFESDIQKLEKEKGDHHPLHRLQDLLEKWSGEDIETTDDLMKFAGELWMTVEEFEKDLKDSLKGHEIIMSVKDYKHSSMIDWIKNKFGFQLDAFDTALNDLKIKCMRDVDRANMQLCDAESRMMRYWKSDNELSSLIYSEAKIKNLQEAMSYIGELKNTMQTMYQKMKQNEIDINDLKLQVVNLEDQKSQCEEQIYKWQQMYKFFQNMSLKYIKEINIVKEKEHEKVLEETKGKMDRQQDYLNLLIELNFSDEMDLIIKLDKVYKEQVGKLYMDLTKLGIVPQQALPQRSDGYGMMINLQDRDRNLLLEHFITIQQASKQTIIEGMSSIQKQGKKDEQQNQQVQSKTSAKGFLERKSTIKLSKKDKKDSKIVETQASHKQLEKDPISKGRRQTKATGMQTSNPQVEFKAEIEKYYEEKYQNLLNQLEQQRNDTNKSSSTNNNNNRNNQNNKEQLKKKLELSSAQIKELQHVIKKGLGKELGSEESVKLFDNNVESFINTLNEIIKEANAQQLSDADSLANLKDDQSKGSYQLKEDSTDQIQQSKKIPMGDYIQMEYSQKTGELVSFSIRPKLASYVFTRDQHDLKSLKDIIKVVMYMNRLLLKGEELLMAQNNNQKHDKQQTQPIVINRQEVFSSSSSEKNLDIDLPGLDKQPFSYDPKKIDEETQTTLQQTSQITKLIKSHLVEVICRISPKDKSKVALNLKELHDDSLLNLSLRGIQIQEQNLTVFEYLTFIIDFIQKGIKHILPFKRRVIDIKELLEQGAVFGNQISQISNSLGRKEIAFSKRGGQNNEQNQSYSDDKELYKKQENILDNYMTTLLKEEISNTIQIMDQFMLNQNKQLKTVNLNEEVNLFPPKEIYQETLAEQSRGKGFPIQKISVSKKFQNSSFHNNYSSFRQKLHDKFRTISESMNHQYMSNPINSQFESRNVVGQNQTDQLAQYNQLMELPQTAKSTTQRSGTSNNQTVIQEKKNQIFGQIRFSREFRNEELISNLASTHRAQTKDGGIRQRSNNLNLSNRNNQNNLGNWKNKTVNKFTFDDEFLSYRNRAIATKNVGVQQTQFPQVDSKLTYMSQGDGDGTVNLNMSREEQQLQQQLKLQSIYHTNQQDLSMSGEQQNSSYIPQSLLKNALKAKNIQMNISDQSKFKKSKSLEKYSRKYFNKTNIQNKEIQNKVPNFEENLIPEYIKQEMERIEDSQLFINE